MRYCSHERGVRDGLSGFYILMVAGDIDTPVTVFASEEDVCRALATAQPGMVLIAADQLQALREVRR